MVPFPLTKSCSQQFVFNLLVLFGHLRGERRGGDLGVLTVIRRSEARAGEGLARGASGRLCAHGVQTAALPCSWLDATFSQLSNAPLSLF